MEKRQRYPKTVGTAIKVTDPTNTTTEGTDFENLNTTLKNLSGGMLTDAQKAYLDAQIQKDLESKVKLELPVTVESGSLTYKGDQDAEASMIAVLKLTAYVNLNGQKVKVDVGGISGWTKTTTTGEYTGTLNSTIKNIPAVTVSYTIPASVSETYAGITVSATASAQAFSISYPVFYGLTDSQDAPTGTDAEKRQKMHDILVNFTKAYGSISGVSSITNSASTSKYLWAVCKGSVDIQQLQGSVFKDGCLTGIEFLSTEQDSEIVLSGYKIYRSANTIGANSSTIFKSFSIKN